MHLHEIENHFLKNHSLLGQFTQAFESLGHIQVKREKKEPPVYPSSARVPDASFLLLSQPGNLEDRLNYLERFLMLSMINITSPV